VEGRRRIFTDNEFEWYDFHIGNAADARKIATYPLDL
jgi:hypothetical protein